MAQQAGVCCGCTAPTLVGWNHPSPPFPTLSLRHGPAGGGLLRLHSIYLCWLEPPLLPLPPIPQAWPSRRGSVAAAQHLPSRPQDLLQRRGARAGGGEVLGCEPCLEMRTLPWGVNLASGPDDDVIVQIEVCLMPPCTVEPLRPSTPSPNFPQPISLLLFIPPCPPPPTHIDLRCRLHQGPAGPRGGQPHTHPGAHLVCASRASVKSSVKSFAKAFPHPPAPTPPPPQVSLVNKDASMLEGECSRGG